MTQSLRDFVLARIAEEDSTAHAAGHGFGHQPVGAPRNAGWTDIDITENCRPDYDARLLRRFTPDRIRAECELKHRLIAQATTARQLNITLAIIGSVWSDHQDYDDSFSLTQVLKALDESNI